MSLVVRKVYNKRDFDILKPDNSFLVAGEIQADAVTDLKTSENKLSIYIVPDDTSIKRVIAALAASREKFQHLDYVILSMDDFENIRAKFQLKVDNKKGKTADSVVNGWHKDLIELSNTRITELARAFIYHGTKSRENWKDVKSLVIKGVENHTLDPKLVNQVLMKTITEEHRL